ncbi:hypothetical protein FUAX_47180 (plasmid) [Fulvitalea axinellae]|uniref:3-keto-alpha-glucoside-1,2-lyase/3-keto-2-hydroxy-glucal hydratase domain-containing protein n=1 Tax=Fulvitalea axinellae TaxID=1182444 RepID=A0AAU9CT61_9BACT|nr:hypothetical protein FUAX_47180 [Fulvitalea axinellae]
MKKTFLTILCAAALAGQGMAQDRRTTETKVVDILAQMPAEKADQCAKLMKELTELQQEHNVLPKLFDMLTTPGTGNDLSARYAVNALARYIGEQDDEADRLAISQAFIKALGTENETEVKDFLIRQIRYIGEGEAIASLSGYLTDERLHFPAAQALKHVGTPEAEAAVLKAAQASTGKIRINLIEVLGDFESKNAASWLLSIKADDVYTKKVQLYALAQSASPKAYGTLAAAAKKAGYLYEETQAVAAFQNYAQRLVEEGDDATGKKVYKNFLKQKSPDRLHLRAFALAEMAEQYGNEILPELIKDIAHTDFRHRGNVRSIILKLNDADATRTLIAELPKANNTVKVEIIDLLGDRKDAIAVNALKNELANPAGNVQAAAIRALGHIQSYKAYDACLEVFQSGKPEAVTQAVNTLTVVAQDSQLDELANNVSSIPASALPEVIRLLGSRSNEDYVGTLMPFISDSNEATRKSALKAISRVVTPAEITPLTKKLLSSSNNGEIKLLQRALIAACQKEKGDKQTAILLQALKKTSKKDRILGMLPTLGGQKALVAVQDVYNTGNGQEKDAAMKSLLSWTDLDALPIIFEVVKDGSSKYQGKAFNGYVKLAKRLPVENKLLKIRQAMPYAVNAKQKNTAVKTLENVQTFTALTYLESLFQDKDVQQAAVMAAMKVTLPSGGRKVGLYGKRVREVMDKVIALMDHPEGAYLKQSIRTYLDAMPKGEGYVSMFNGKDLSGWQGLVENPIKRAKMSKRQLAAKQKIANKKMTECWSVRDGMIVFNGKGANLCSVKEYGDFEMLVDWRITKGGDSGIYLRGTPQVQIWDIANTHVGAQVGSGGLYNNKKHKSKPLQVADNPVGEWNSFYIKMEGEKVTVKLNGITVVDNVTMDNYWDRKQAIFPTGAIELQAHGSDLTFRDIFVKEIKADEYNLTETEKAEGFVSLFNGKDLDKWQGDKKSYVVEDGVIAVKPAKGGWGNLYTNKEYADFNYRFEFKLTPGANNGLGIRTPLKGDAAYVGMELQILDNEAPVFANLQPYQYHGSVYGIHAAKRGFHKPMGEWNTQEVIVKGDHIKVILNGTVITDCHLKEALKNGPKDHKNHPGAYRKKGHIGYLGHGSKVWFRNIRIKDLSKDQAL